MTRDLLTGANFSGPLQVNGSAGTAGQVLQSAGPGQVPTWATPSGSGSSFAGYAVGNWISPVLGAVSAGIAHVANNIYLFPFILQRSISVDALGARVTSASVGSSTQLAIYSSLSGLPTGTPLASTGNLSSAATGTITASVTSFNISAGAIYWMATNSGGTPILQHLSAASNAIGYILGSDSIGDITNAAAVASYYRIFAQTFGTWPNLTGASTTKATGAGRGGIVYLKVSALL
jgi:hypothetical protein